MVLAHMLLPTHLEIADMQEATPAWICALAHIVILANLFTAFREDEAVGHGAMIPVRAGALVAARRGSNLARDARAGYESAELPRADQLDDAALDSITQRQCLLPTNQVNPARAMLELNCLHNAEPRRELVPDTLFPRY